MILSAAARFAKKLFPYWAVAWCSGLLLVAATLGASHLYPLPRPVTGDAALAKSLAELRGGDQGILVFHALYAECRCSRAVVEHLIERGPMRGTREHVLWVGHGARELVARLTARGFVVHELSEGQLAAEYHITAAPLLVVVGPNDELRYVGGHTSHKQGLDYQDVAIVADIAADRRVKELPSFGCAIAKDLQRRLDPLSLRYVRD